MTLGLKDPVWSSIVPKDQELVEGGYSGFFTR